MSQSSPEPKRVKVLAVASKGGHWIQLLRLMNAFEDTDIAFVSTHESLSEMLPDRIVHTIADGNRKRPFKLLVSFFQVLRIVSKERPNVIVTTGAASGLMALFAGYLFGAKTLWIDSVANVQRLSLSGSIASLFVDRIYTQWPHLAKSKILYAGSVLV